VKTATSTCIPTSRSSNLSLAAKAAFGASLRRLKPGAARIPGRNGYVASLEDNLLDGIAPELYQPEFAAGAGQELEWKERCPPKMHAAHSSSALVVNSFALWKRDAPLLRLAGLGGFRGLRFEAKCATGLGGTAPHPDVLGERGPLAPVAIESKATEYLDRHGAAFSPAYDTFEPPAAAAPYYALIRTLRAEPGAFGPLDASQLIKHALGLGATFRGQEPTLLYVYWEPANREEFAEFQAHRAGIASFARAVAGAGIRFVPLSYSELWDEWSRLEEQPAWLGAHLLRLRARYQISLPATA
jgi:hypothetical protein